MSSLAKNASTGHTVDVNVFPTEVPYLINDELVYWSNINSNKATAYMMLKGIICFDCTRNGPMMMTASYLARVQEALKEEFPVTRHKHIIMVNHMNKIKDDGHFVNGIDMRGLGLDPGVKVHVWPKHLDEKVAAVPLGKLGAKLYISVRATDVPGDGDVGKGCAAVTNQPGSYIMAIVSDPISASQAIMKGVQDWILVYAVSEADIKVNNMKIGKLTKLSKEQPHYISFLAA